MHQGGREAGSSGDGGAGASDDEGSGSDDGDGDETGSDEACDAAGGSRRPPGESTVYDCRGTWITRTEAADDGSLVRVSSACWHREQAETEEALFMLR